MLPLQVILPRTRLRFPLPALVIASLLISLASPGQGDEPVSSDAWKAARKEAAHRQRRVILDNDGNDPWSIHMQSPTREQFLAARTTQTADTQVDTIFYCTGAGIGNTSRNSKVFTPHVTTEGFYHDNKLGDLLKAGVDPLATVVAYGHEHGIEVFQNLRMNDGHDSNTSSYGPYLLKENAFKSAHPEFLLGQPQEKLKAGRWTNVDYSHPEVRDFVLAYLVEAMTDYDIDGVHLDFFRHIIYFPSTARGEVATADECEMMTDLIRKVRKAADDIGQKRGRPMLVSIRVPDSAEYAKAVGLDFESWLADDLVDILCVTSYFRLNEWKYSVDLGHKYNVPVYPSLDDIRIEDEEARTLRTTPAAYRGRAANVWQAGADGVMLFNYFDRSSKTWKQFGSLDTLLNRDRDYFGSERGVRRSPGNNHPYADYQFVETLNPDNPESIVPGETASAELQVGENLAAASKAQVTLKLRFSAESSPEDYVVKVNGHAVTMRPGTGQWLEGSPEKSIFQPGMNTVTVASSARSEPAKWEDLMLQVREESESGPEKKTR